MWTRSAPRCSRRERGVMRIALCADGRSPHTQRWANAVVERGHELVVVWARREYAPADRTSFHPSITHVVHDPPHRDRLWRLPTAGLEPRLLARRLRPDVVHGLSLTGHGWTAQEFGIRPLVLTALGTDVLELEGRREHSSIGRVHASYVARRTRRAVGAADVVLADSTTLAARVRCSVPGTATRIIRFGIEIEDSVPRDPLEWRRRLNFADDAFVILSSRLIRPAYNIDAIVQALPAIRRELPNAVLVLKELPRFSDTAYRAACLELAGTLGVADAVRTVGELSRDELLDLQAASDTYVSAPANDGTAVSVLEAMAAGVAVVATDVPGIDPVILVHDQTALLVPPRDAAAIAAAVVRLGRDEQLRRRLADRARQVVERYADFERELDQAVLLYEELVVARSRNDDLLPSRRMRKTTP